MKINNDLNSVNPEIVNVSDMREVSWKDTWFINNHTNYTNYKNQYATENTQKVLIAFNGPPSSGKTNFFTPAVDDLMRSKGIDQPDRLAFSDVIYKAVGTLYDISQTQLKEIEKYGDKNTPLDVFFGKSLRQTLIALSEDFLKPYHGDRKVIARMLARKVSRSRVAHYHSENIVHILDTGFHDELEGYLEELKAHNFQYDHIMLFRLHREGCSFKGDSRSYITENHVDEINRKVGLNIADFDLENAPLDGNGCSRYTMDKMTEEALSKMGDIVLAPFIL